MKRFREILWFPWAILMCFLGAVAVLPLTFLAPRLTFKVARLWARSMLGFAGIRVEVVGKENLVPGPLVVIANHRSLLDIPILFEALPYDVCFVAKKELFYIPVFGIAMKLMGHVMVDRGDKAQAKESIRKAAAQIKGGTTITVFPEGTRSNVEAMRPFKKGAFILSIQSGVPILPVTLGGSLQVLEPGEWFAHPGVVRVIVHPAIAVTGYTMETKDELVARTSDMIGSALTLPAGPR